MDEAGVLWLGGRLSRAKLPYDMLHPQILSDKHLFAKLIFGGGASLQMMDEWWMTRRKFSLLRKKTRAMSLRR
jgi:hypothetical protein